MPDRPLLLFPSRARISYESNSGGNSTSIKRPGKIEQIGRVNTMFKRIDEAFESRKVLLNQAADGLAPEMVLVFETRGTIADFFKGVAQVPDLKWLGEYERDFPPSNEYQDEDDPSKPIAGKLFFVLVNNAALRQLKSLWSTWQTKKQSFRHGLTKWKHLFGLLYDIRPWGIKDRLEETGILDDLQDRIARNQETIPIEVELWYRKSISQRRIAVERLTTLINAFHGQVLQECTIVEIGYHALLVRAPITIFDTLNSQDEVKFFQSSEIMHLRPSGQTVEIFDGENGLLDGPSPANDDQLLPPLIALLDGVPVQNHSLLLNRISLYDPDGFETNYPASARIHGTGMASIIIHGDLNGGSDEINSQLLVRPVMHFYPSGEDSGEERMPDHLLLVDLVHRAVKEIIEGNAGTAPIAPTVKVINISLGDRYRVFDNYVSIWARLIDWLSYKYDILFIVSAGNVLDDVQFNLNGSALNDLLLSPADLQNAVIQQFFGQNRHRKIISPAESINALTVGAAHADDSTIQQLNNRINLITSADLASPVSRMGLGFRRSIKPDILANGGRVLYRESAGATLQVMSKAYARPPGIKVAAPSEGVNGTRFSAGTSNAAAFVSHVSAKLFESFLSDKELNESLSGSFFAVASKALIVHSASWNDDAYSVITNSIPSAPNKRELASRFLGYGTINPERIIECTDKRVTLIGIGSVRPEDAYLYELPLPDELSGITNWRKLIVTLAWFTPINVDSQLYRTHKLWFDFPGTGIETMLKAKRQYYDDDAVRRGTIQHEVFYSDKSQAFETDSSLKIKVNCKSDAFKHDTNSYSSINSVKSVKYCLAVTLEIDAQIPIDIYERTAIKIKEQVRTA